MAAVHVLAASDLFGAPNRVALRDDAAALTLCDTAMVQLDDLARAKFLLRRTARTFGAREAVARVRCIVVEAEAALASRDLGWLAKTLHTACATPKTHGDHVNTVHARCLSIRRLLLIGRLDDAEAALAALAPTPPSSALRAARALVVAGITIRRLQTSAVRAALSDAERAAHQVDVPTPTAEAERTALASNAPAVCLISRDEKRVLRPDDVEALFASDVLVVDACRSIIRQIGMIIPLAMQPVLLTLARAPAEAWPKDETRNAFIVRALRTRHPDESHRMWLHVEIGRLRAAFGMLGTIKATRHRFALQPHAAQAVVVLTQPMTRQYAAVLAYLTGRES